MKYFFVFVAIVLLFGCIGGEQKTKPLYSEEKIKGELKDYLVEWWGFWDVDVTGLEFVGGRWFANVSITSESGTIPTQIMVYESNLSDKFEVLWMNKMLSQPLGVVELEGRQSCSENGKLKVMLFADPYCEACIMHRQAVKELKEKFGEAIDFEYRILLTESILLAQQKAMGNASLETEYAQAYRMASKYFLCVQQQSKQKLEEFEDCFYAKYEENNWEAVGREQLDECAYNAELDEEELNSCMTQGDLLIYSDNALASTYLVPAVTPRMVIDCRVKATMRTAEYAVCKKFPETSGC